MPVTKGTKSGDDAEKLNQMQCPTRNSPIEKSTDVKIPEQKEAQEMKKERQPQEDTHVSAERIGSLSVEQSESEAQDDTAAVKASEFKKKGSSTTRSEVSITSIASSESQQTEGAAEIENQNFSGDGINSPDITSSLSGDTLSGQGEELEAQVSQGSDFQCRSCNSRYLYTPRKDKPNSCSDLCPKCELATTSTLIRELATTSPFFPRVSQPGNPVKNPRNEIPLQRMAQQDEEPQSPVLAVAVVEPGRPPEDHPPPEDNPAPKDNPPPGDEQLQVGQGATTTTTNASANADNPLGIKVLKVLFIIFCVAVVVMWSYILFPELFPGRESTTAPSNVPADTPFRDILLLPFRDM